MDKNEFKNKVKSLVKDIYKKKIESQDASLAYEELQAYPKLKEVILRLLTKDFDKFMESIDWVSPRPLTFRINLLNGQNFTLSDNGRSWIAKVQGKKYYLLNLDEEELAAQAISRILEYGNFQTDDGFEDEDEDITSDDTQTDDEPEEDIE